MIEGEYIEPLGCYLLVQRSGKRIKRIYFSSEPPGQSSQLAEMIADYLAGRAPCPEVELETADLTDYQKRIFALVREIPRGETLTYSQVAELAGQPRAARAVGRAMASNPFAIVVPCHRVVARAGLGGYRFGLEIKKRLLGQERGQL